MALTSGEPLLPPSCLAWPVPPKVDTTFRAELAALRMWTAGGVMKLRCHALSGLVPAAGWLGGGRCA
jgi:hypothetical protein